MIYMETIAYNASRTLRRTVESVLNQTYGNFTYYLCDNGSIDNGETRKIVEEYAKQDCRIVPFYNKENHVWTDNKEVIMLPHNIGPEDFYCHLDADDEYEITFLEEMLSFMNRYGLDVAACGNDMIDAADNHLLGQRLLSRNLVIEGNDFQKYFAVYHQFMRTIWGKLYKGKSLVNTVLDVNSPEIPRAYGNDTFFTMRAFGSAERAGILAKSLHKYYISSTSTSYQFHPERIKSDIILHETALDYLKPYGKLSLENESFLYQVYGNATLDTLIVILRSAMPVAEKIQHVRELLAGKYIGDMLRSNFKSNEALCIQLQQVTVKWLLAQQECSNPVNAYLVAKIITFLYEDLPETIDSDCLQYLIIKMPETIEWLIEKDYHKVMERLQTWYKKHARDIAALTKLEFAMHTNLNSPDDTLFSFFKDVLEKRPNSAGEMYVKEELEALLSKYPLLKDLGTNLALAFPNVICLVLRESYEKALDHFLSKTNVEIDDEDAEHYILFGQNLSSAAGDAPTYVYFKKIWISYLMDCLRLKEADEELAAFEQILPEDEEFIGLRERLTQLQE